MTNWLKNVTPTKSKLSVHIDQELIEQFKGLLEFFQESQPGAELDHIVESAMTDYLNGNKPHMKAYKAWLKEKEAQEQEAAQEPPLQESAKNAKARPAVSLASGESKPSHEEILQRAYKKDKDSSTTAT